MRAPGSSLAIRSDKRKARDIAIAVALTLSNQFHIDSRVECLHCVVGTVLMLYHAPCNRANRSSSSNFHQVSLKTSEPWSFRRDLLETRMPLGNFKNHFGVICAWVNIDDTLFFFGSRKKNDENLMYRKHLWSIIMIYIFVPFFSVTDCDQNYMQMINLKKLPEYWQYQIIQNFRNSSRSCATFIFWKTCRSSLRTRTLDVLYLFLNVRIPCATSTYSSCGLTKVR